MVFKVEGLTDIYTKDGSKLDRVKDFRYTAKIGYLLYKCSYILCAVYGLVYVWPTFHEEINM